MKTFLSIGISTLNLFACLKEVEKRKKTKKMQTTGNQFHILRFEKVNAKVVPKQVLEIIALLALLQEAKAQPQQKQ